MTTRPQCAAANPARNITLCFPSFFDRGQFSGNPRIYYPKNYETKFTYHGESRQSCGDQGSAVNPFSKKNVA
jgi:hypothetical protein